MHRYTCIYVINTFNIHIYTCIHAMNTLEYAYIHMYIGYRHKFIFIYIWIYVINTIIIHIYTCTYDINRIHTYSCTYVYMYMRVCPHILYIYSLMYIHIFVHVYIYSYIWTHVYRYIYHIHIRIFIYIYIYSLLHLYSICTFVHMNSCIYIHISYTYPISKINRVYRVLYVSLDLYNSLSMYHTRRRPDLKQLRLPKLLTSVHGISRTYQTRFHGSPHNFI